MASDDAAGARQQLFTFVVEGECHTLGALVAERLVAEDECLFASYRVPHPLSKEVHITVGALAQLDAQKALQRAAEALARDVRQLIEQLEPPGAHAPPGAMDTAPPREVRVRRGVPLRNKDMI